MSADERVEPALGFLPAETERVGHFVVDTEDCAFPEIRDDEIPLVTVATQVSQDVVSGLKEFDGAPTERGVLSTDGDQSSHPVEQ